MIASPTTSRTASSPCPACGGEMVASNDRYGYDCLGCGTHWNLKRHHADEQTIRRCPDCAEWYLVRHPERHPHSVASRAWNGPAEKSARPVARRKRSPGSFAIGLDEIFSRAQAVAS